LQAQNKFGDPPLYIHRRIYDRSRNNAIGYDPELPRAASPLIRLFTFPQIYDRSRKGTIGYDPVPPRAVSQFIIRGNLLSWSWSRPSPPGSPGDEVHMPISIEHKKKQPRGEVKDAAAS
jgi:hypothetical protein